MLGLAIRFFRDCSMVHHHRDPLATGSLPPASPLHGADFQVANSPLLKETSEPGLLLAGKVCHVGIGCSPKGMPIDVVALLLSAEGAAVNHVLVADEFMMLNGASNVEALAAGDRTVEALTALRSAFGLKLEILRATDMVATERFREILRETRAQLSPPELAEMARATVPESRRRVDPSGEYAINEIASTRYLIEAHGVQVKIGPEREKLYDRIMQRLGMPIAFGYAIDALPLSTRDPRSVVHYIATDGGETRGARICFQEFFVTVNNKLRQMSRPTALYLLALSNEAARKRGEVLAPIDRLATLRDDALRTIVSERLKEHVIKPVRRCLGYDDSSDGNAQRQTPRDFTGGGWSLGD